MQSLARTVQFRISRQTNIDVRDFCVNNMIHGHPIFKDLWMPFLGEKLELQSEVENE